MKLKAQFREGRVPPPPARARLRTRGVGPEPSYLHAQLVEDETSRVAEETVPLPAELHHAVPVVVRHCGGTRRSGRVRASDCDPGAPPGSERGDEGPRGSETQAAL